MQSHERTFDVYLVRIYGEPVQAAEDLAASFGIPPSQAQLLIAQCPVRVKHNASSEQAKHCERRLRELGADVETIETTPAAAAVATVAAPVAAPRSSDAALARPLSHESVDETPRRSLWSMLAPWTPMLGIALAAAIAYGVCTAGTMGGLDVERVGAKRDGAPALVLLHGFGAPGEDLVGLARELEAYAPQAQIIVPEGPVSAGMGRAWWKSSLEEAHEAREAVLEIIDELVEGGTPPDRIVIAGFSQGAILAMDVGLHARYTLGGVAMLSGKKQDGLGWTAAIPDKTDLDVLITHGTRDSVLPMRPMKSFADELIAAGYRAEFVSFDGSHQIPDTVRATLGDWVRTQLDGAFY